MINLILLFQFTIVRLSLFRWQLINLKSLRDTQIHVILSIEGIQISLALVIAIFLKTVAGQENQKITLKHLTQ